MSKFIDSNAVQFLVQKSEYVVNDHTYVDCEHCKSAYRAEEIIEDWWNLAMHDHYNRICVYCHEELDAENPPEDLLCKD